MFVCRHEKCDANSSRSAPNCFRSYTSLLCSISRCRECIVCRRTIRFFLIYRNHFAGCDGFGGNLVLYWFGCLVQTATMSYLNCAVLLAVSASLTAAFACVALVARLAFLIGLIIRI